jgi:hypothetical protein
MKETIKPENAVNMIRHAMSEQTIFIRNAL